MPVHSNDVAHRRHTDGNGAGLSKLAVATPEGIAPADYCNDATCMDDDSSASVRSVARQSHRLERGTMSSN